MDNHSQFYLQSAKVLEDPALAAKLADELARVIEKFGIKFDSVLLASAWRNFWLDMS